MSVRLASPSEHLAGDLRGGVFLLDELGLADALDADRLAVGRLQADERGLADGAEVCAGVGVVAEALALAEADERVLSPAQRTEVGAPTRQGDEIAVPTPALQQRGPRVGALPAGRAGVVGGLKVEPLALPGDDRPALAVGPVGRRAVVGTAHHGVHLRTRLPAPPASGSWMCRWMAS